MIKLLLLLAMLFTVSCEIGLQECPSKEEIAKVFSGQGISLSNIESIQPISDIDGVCEVVIRNGINVFIFYTNYRGDRFIIGSIIDPTNRVNLTLNRKEELTGLNKEHLAKLENLVDIEYGDGDKYVYYITDPDCSVCREQEEKLLNWAMDRKVKIKIILYPLPIHPNAKKRSVSILCDKKGFKAIMEEYESENQCEEGKSKISENIKFLSNELKIIGLPHVIGSNGKIVSGVLREDELDKLVD